MTRTTTASDRTLLELPFENRFASELPVDTGPAQPRQVFGACSAHVTPTPVSNPRTLATSREVMALLGLAEHEAAGVEFARVFSGNAVLPAMRPFAACYGGHQFGSWAGQLGDGRAISLGEAGGPDGRSWELQLKGAGRTPFSRGADGRAVMRSSVREFLCSEAMHHLGVPTTRALSLVGTGDQIVRDMFYDGNPREEPGAVVCRVAPSFIRFGNFEIFAARGDERLLRELTDFTLRHFYPLLGAPGPATYAALFEEICHRTVEMIVGWMRVGFVHGVMNTDNMSILGLTIDYGPYGWLEGYEPGWTPNTTDAQGRRYCFGNQPGIALWNLLKLAEALVPLTGDTEPLERTLRDAAASLDRRLSLMQLGKRGLSALPERFESDAAETDALSALLQITEVDMTLFFRGLGQVKASAASTAERMAPLLPAFYAPSEIDQALESRFGTWLERYLERARSEGVDDDTRRARMNAVNPKYVARNYLAQLAIDSAEQGDGSKVADLLDVLRHPYDEQPGREAFAEKRPEWARHRAGCSMLSCSS